MKGVIKTIISSAVLVIVFQLTTSAQIEELKSEHYTWKNVQMVGGGFVTGIIFHPTEKNLCYCRTDMGGAYKRNPKTMKWEPLLDWVSYEDRNTMGVESIALDPSDANRVYLACGTYTSPDIPNACILRSSDQGKTFQRTDVPFKMGGNENGRGNGERMAVDPNNGNIIYCGTRHNGLWESTDRGVTWNQVLSFPNVNDNPPESLKTPQEIQNWRWNGQGSGIILVVFDPNSKTENGSSTIYVGASLMNRNNLFKSTDSGKSWRPVQNAPEQYRPTHGVLSSEGMLYITYANSPGPSWITNGAVWKLNINSGEWTDISPLKPDPTKNLTLGYIAVSVDANNPQTLIVSTFGLETKTRHDDIYRSTDGGKTWKSVLNSGKTIFDYSLAPYVQRTPIHWMFDIEIDPTNPDHAIVTIGYGGYETYNLSNVDKGLPTNWSVMSTGIEETVALELLSPPKGAHLISAIGDYGGFVHWNLDKPAEDGNFNNPHFLNCSSVACAENNPEIIIRSGVGSYRNPGVNFGYSLDGGKTWQPTESVPDKQARLGFVAVSANGNTWIWAPSPINRSQLIPVYYTKDNGKSWNECKGLPGNTRVIADKVNAEIFYGMNLFDGKLFISNDGGKSYSEQKLNLPDGIPTSKANRGDDRGGQDKIYAAPGFEGDLWIPAFNGLYHSINIGKTFEKLNGVQEIHAFGFGKEAPDKNYPALYLIGVVDGVRGIFRSDDTAKSWIRINDDQHQWGLVLQITGDPKIYGRVYVGTHGRGTVYGDPIK